LDPKNNDRTDPVILGGPSREKGPPTMGEEVSKLNREEGGGKVTPKIPTEKSDLDKQQKRLGRKKKKGGKKRVFRATVCEVEAKKKTKLDLGRGAQWFLNGIEIKGETGKAGGDPRGREGKVK